MEKKAKKIILEIEEYANLINEFRRTDEVLEVVLRELTAIGRAWRLDWSDFDGRHLRDQLDNLADWAREARSNVNEEEYTAGTEFLEITKERLGR